MPSSQPSLFDASLQSLRALEESFEAVEVLTALPTDAYDAKGNPVEVVDVSFRIRGRPGTFSVQPSFDQNWAAQAFFQIGIRHAEIEAIYQGLSSVNDLTYPPPANPAPAIPTGPFV